MKKGTWATQKKNLNTLTEAYNDCRHVILFFSVNNSRAFQGYVSPPFRNLSSTIRLRAIRIVLANSIFRRLNALFSPLSFLFANKLTQLQGSYGICSRGRADTYLGQTAHLGVYATVLH